MPLSPSSSRELQARGTSGDLSIIGQSLLGTPRGKLYPAPMSNGISPGPKPLLSEHIVFTRSTPKLTSGVVPRDAELAHQSDNGHHPSAFMEQLLFGTMSPPSALPRSVPAPRHFSVVDPVFVADRASMRRVYPGLAHAHLALQSTASLDLLQRRCLDYCPPVTPSCAPIMADGNSAHPATHSGLGVSIPWHGKAICITTSRHSLGLHPWQQGTAGLPRSYPYSSPAA